MPLPALPAIPAEPAAPELPATAVAPALAPAPELVPPLPAELDVPAVPAELLLPPAGAVEPLEPGCPATLDVEPPVPGVDPEPFSEEQATTESNVTEARRSVLFMVSDLETYRDQWNAERQTEEGERPARRRDR